MLRTWTMFSTGFLKETTGHGLEIVPAEVKDRIKETLHVASVAVDSPDWKPEQIRQTRNEVMHLLEPYFEHASIKVRPLVAEELIESDGTDASKRYAERLRSHPRTRDMLKREYKGLQDLLDGTYQGKL